MTYDEDRMKSALINLAKMVESGMETEKIQRDPMFTVVKRVISDMKIDGNLQPIPEEISLSDRELEILENLISFDGNTRYSITDPAIISLRQLDFVVAGAVSRVVKWGDGTETVGKINEIPVKITDRGISWLNDYRSKRVVAEIKNFL